MIRTAIAGAAVSALALAACGGDPDRSASPAATAPASVAASAPTSSTVPVATTAPVESVTGGLHECASGFPVPTSATLVESASGDLEGDQRSCVVTLSFDGSVPQAVDVLASTFSSAGWAAAVEQQDAEAGFVRITSPTCGTAIVLPAEQVLETPSDAPTGALVSLHACP